MSEKIEVDVLRHLHIQMLEGGETMRVYEDGEGEGDMDPPAIFASREAAIEDVRRRLGCVAGELHIERAETKSRRSMEQLVEAVRAAKMESAEVEAVAKKLRIKPATAKKVLASINGLGF